MFKHLLIAVAAAASMIGAAHAQGTITAGSGAVSGSTSAVIVGGMTGGAGGAAAGGILGSGILGQVGQTTGGNSVVNSDACQKIYNYTVGPIGVGGSSIVKLCWGTRMAELVKTNPPGSMGYELFCTEDAATDNMFLDFDWRSGIMACVRNREKLAKMQPTRTAATVAAPAAAPAIPPGCRLVPGTTAVTC